MTLLDFEDRVEHALFRGAYDALMLHSAFGAKKKSGEPLTLDDFYGWELSEIRGRGKASTPLTEDQRQEQAAKLALAQMQLYEAQIRANRPEMIEGDGAPGAMETTP